jgi:hypothetical protein
MMMMMMMMLLMDTIEHPRHKGTRKSMQQQQDHKKLLQGNEKRGKRKTPSVFRETEVLREKSEVRKRECG